jgi:hypothetical protein
MADLDDLPKAHIKRIVKAKLSELQQVPPPRTTSELGFWCCLELEWKEGRQRTDTGHAASWRRSSRCLRWLHEGGITENAEQISGTPMSRRFKTRATPPSERSRCRRRFWRYVSQHCAAHRLSPPAFQSFKGVAPNLCLSRPGHS